MKTLIHASQMIALVLERTTCNMEWENARSPKSSKALKCFDSTKIPKISLKGYLARIQRYANCSDSCYIVAFIYIDRLLQNNKNSALTRLNIHRIILTAIILAIKYLDDSYFDNEIYSKIGGISLSEMNMLELNMLKLLNYTVYTNSSLYCQYKEELEWQSLKIEEDIKSMSEPMDCLEECLIPIKNINSEPSFGTVPSFIVSNSQ